MIKKSIDIENAILKCSDEEEQKEHPFRESNPPAERLLKEVEFEGSF